MRIARLEEMMRGWFVGNFEPSVLKTNAAEVGIKSYKKGDYEPKHHHKIATEITAIIKGRVRMNGETYQEGDIIILYPGDASDFEALEEVVSVVVKVPGVNDDKYLGECV